MIIWIVQNLDTGTEEAFATQGEACRRAEAIVGNRAAAPWTDGFFYGPGDGTTSVMVRHFSREMAARMFPDAVNAMTPPKTE